MDEHEAERQHENGADAIAAGELGAQARDFLQHTVLVVHPAADERLQAAAVVPGARSYARMLSM